MKTKTNSIYFNAHHSPVGAFATFTLGFPGKKGGLGLELGAPAEENIYIGLESASGKAFEALPFFVQAESEARRYEITEETSAAGPELRPFALNKVRREFGACCDTWAAGDLSFSIYSPFKQVPDPAKASKSAMAAAIVPAVFARLTVDNRKGKRPRKAFFGYQGSDRYSSMRRMDDVSGGKFTGVAQGLRTAIVSNSPGVYSGQGFAAENCLVPDFRENLTFGLGTVGLLMAEVPAGELRTFSFAICFHRAGTVTSGMKTEYFYTEIFPDLESVAEFALDHHSRQVQLAEEFDARFNKIGLSEDQKFHLAHATRSYFGSTQFLRADGEPFWVVNEGEYRMMNTFDLTVDHLFFEISNNPWVVRNQLDWFVNRFSYRDGVRLPGESTEYPGGISFTHDMGIANHVSRPGFSTYELFGLKGCFSHMTHEQLVNWVLCAVTYVVKTGDKPWLKKRLEIFRDCLESLENRDHPDPSLRDGVMSADSSRCLGGSEITTYDSLDVSLGQARNNLYLSVKTWSAYLGLEKIFHDQKDAARAKRAARQAERCASTVASHLRKDGFIPAVMGEGNESRIIPAIEGLVFPKIWGLPAALKLNGKFARLLQSLKRHHQTVLRRGVCLFPDGGWKISSTNDNSWLSKIYLCQFVAEEVLGLPASAESHRAHRSWLLHAKQSYWSWSDQIVAGFPQGSKYYPRGVTSWLWLKGKLSFGQPEKTKGK